MKYIFVFVLLLLVGCGQELQPQVQLSLPHQDSVAQTLYVLGDSLSAWYQLPLEQSYPMILQAKLKNLGYHIRVVNAGKSGDTSAGLKERLDRVIADAESGDIALVVIGANDGLQGLAVEQLEQNILDITKVLQSRYIKTIIGGLQIPTNLGLDYRTAFADVYPRVAQETESVLLPFLLSGVAGIPNLNLPDGIHPNASGHMIIADWVLSMLISNVKLLYK